MKIAKALLFLLLLAFGCGITFGQNAEGLKHIENVKKALIYAKADTNRVWLYIDLCTAYQWTDDDSLALYGRKGLELAQQFNFPRGEVRLLNSLGIASSFRGDIPKALEILFRALGIAEKYGFQQETAICLNSIGACYFFLNDYKKSIDFTTKARRIDETISHNTRDTYWKIYIAFWSGATYSDLNQLDSAAFFLQKAYDDAFHTGFTDLYNIGPTILMFYGEVYFKKGVTKTAFNYLHESLAKYSSCNDLIGTADACTIISGFFKQMNRPDSAIYYARKDLDAAAKFNYKSAVINNSKLLADLYESKDIAQAHYYLRVLLAASDSLYGAQQIHALQRTLSDEQQRRQQLIEEQIKKENRLKQYGFMVGIGVLLIIAFLLFRNNRQRKKANVFLQRQKEKVENTLQELKATQAQLLQSEKMASLGELTAGIAHEIQNPLNFVNNFSGVNKELLAEMKAEIEKGNFEEVKALVNDIAENELRIYQHGKRADAIVKGMLEHSRTSKGERQAANLNALTEEYLKLAYHGFRAKDKSFNATLETQFDKEIGKVNIVPPDIGRVLLNLFNNAFYAVQEKKKSQDGTYEPTVSVTTKSQGNQVEIRIKDNGTGIPKKVLDKIYQPFFTTKPTGEGTGLGLSLSYDIITKGHGGELQVKTTEGEGTEFIIELPATKQTSTYLPH